MNTTIYFYQSGSAVNTKVDFDNPVHKELYDLAMSGATPCARANKLMRLAGLSSTLSIRNTIAWSSDLYIVSRGNDTGMIDEHLSGPRT